MKELREFFTRFSQECYGILCKMDAEGRLYFTAFERFGDNRALDFVITDKVSVENAQALLREFNK